MKKTILDTLRKLGYLSVVIIENCVAYAPFILQFSIWKTATIRAINHAVIHKIVFFVTFLLLADTTIPITKQNVSKPLEP